jgi:hypothetical protein
MDLGAFRESAESFCNKNNNFCYKRKTSNYWTGADLPSRPLKFANPGGGNGARAAVRLFPERSPKWLKYRKFLRQF